MTIIHGGAAAASEKTGVNFASPPPHENRGFLGLDGRGAVARGLLQRFVRDRDTG